ncbi:MAG TPA: radical SAM protein [Nanoarchaeota archaeon]|nr:radical SAM protein [Nanoarchaeota archaeon]
MAIDTLYWEITGACNQSCKHCHLGGPSEYSQISREEALSRIDEFYENGIETLLLTGGEPLLNPQVYGMIKHARDYGIDVALLTNGTLIDKRRAELLADAGPSTVQISIDGMEGYHDSIRGRGAFGKLECAVKNLGSAGITPLMKMTINKYNIENVMDVIGYCSHFGLRVNFSLAQELGNVKENSIMPAPKDYFRLFLEMHRKKKAENLSITLPDFSIEEYIETGVPKSGCSAGRRMATITKEDYVIPCVFMSGLGLKETDGASRYDRAMFHSPGRLFGLIKEQNSSEFGCPLRKWQYGTDPYSVYEFARLMK